MFPQPESIRIISVIIPIVSFIFGIKRSIYAVIGYMLFVYWKVTQYYPSFKVINTEFIFGILTLIIVFMASNSKEKASLNFNPAKKYFLYFLTAYAISFSLAWDYQFSWDKAVYDFIQVLILSISTFLALNDRKDLKIFIWSFILMYVYLCYEPLYNFLMKTGGIHESFGDVYIAEIGILSGHVAMANNMNQMIPIVFFLAFTVKNKALKVLSAIPLLIFVISLVASASRAGVIGFLFFLITFFYFSKKRLKTIISLIIVLLIILTTTEYFYSTAARIDWSNVVGRLTGAIRGIEIILAGNHIFGVGPGCFELASGKYFHHTMMSHNLYGQVLGDLGIPGTIAWFFFILHTFKNLINAKKKLKSLSMENDFLYKLAMGIQTSLIVRLFVGLGSHGLYIFYWYAMAALSIVILNIVEKMPENQHFDQI